MSVIQKSNDGSSFERVSESYIGCRLENEDITVLQVMRGCKDHYIIEYVPRKRPIKGAPEPKPCIYCKLMSVSDWIVNWNIDCQMERDGYEGHDELEPNFCPQCGRRLEK